MSAGKIVLIGQARWVRTLAAGLAESGSAVVPLPLDTMSDAMSLRTWRHVATADLIVRVGFRPGAKTIRGVAFDMVLRLCTPRHARTCCYWIGSDVQRALEDSARGTRVAGWRVPIHAAHYHLAGSTPLAEELASIGIEASVAAFPWRTVTPPAELPAMPETFTALTYVPDARFEYYGGPVIVEVARMMPEVRFRVMGGTGVPVQAAPENIEWLGWVDDPTSLYAESTCVIRLTEHDSIGGTAVEGLLFGRPVVYTGTLRYARHVDASAEQVRSALEELVGLYAEGRLAPDTTAASWARSEFDADRRFMALATKLEQLAGTDRPT